MSVLPSLLEKREFTNLARSSLQRKCLAFCHKFKAKNSNWIIRELNISFASFLDAETIKKPTVSLIELNKIRN